MKCTSSGTLARTWPMLMGTGAELTKLMVLYIVAVAAIEAVSHVVAHRRGVSFARR